MYARCTISQYPPERVDEAIEFGRDEVVPIGRQLPGFRGLLAFINRGNGKGMTFTLWDTKEDRDASAERAKQVRGEVDQKLDREVVAVEDYELVFETR